MHIHKKKRKKIDFLYRMLPMGGSVKCIGKKKMTAVGQSFFCYQEKRNNYPFWL